VSHPLVLLPGMLCSPRLWDGVLDTLGARLGTVDARPLPLQGRSVDACVDAVLATAPPRFALAGLSLGGIVAMALRRRAPDRVSRLCLLATSARPPSGEQLDAWARTRAALAAGTTVREVQRDLLPLLLGPSATAEHAATTLAMADDVGRHALDAQLQAQATRRDERPALTAVTEPTLVLAGEADRLCPVEKLAEIRALVPRSRLMVLRGAGHLLTIEDPVAVGEAMAGWLAPPQPGEAEPGRSVANSAMSRWVVL
jgi:pimeloyl-ACP methyl ester carboxylesterase